MHTGHSSLLPSCVPTMAYLTPDKTCYSFAGCRLWQKWKSTCSFSSRSKRQLPGSHTPQLFPVSLPLVKDAWFIDSNQRDSDNLWPLHITLETSSHFDQRDNYAQVPLSPGRTSVWPAQFPPPPWASVTPSMSSKNSLRSTVLPCCPQYRSHTIWCWFKLFTNQKWVKRDERKVEGFTPKQKAIKQG